MNPPSAAELISEVYSRLGIYDDTVLPLEVMRALNRQLDLWTRDNELVQMPLIQNLLTTNPQTLYAAPGFQVSRVLAIKINDGSHDVVVMTADNGGILTAKQMDDKIPDWRTSTTTATYPSLAVLDFAANSPGRVASPRSVFFWPHVTTAITNGLVVDYVAATDGILKGDDDRIPAQASYAKEYLIEKTIEALLWLPALKARRDEADRHEVTAGREGRKVRRKAASERSGDRSSYCYFT